MDQIKVISAPDKDNPYAVIYKPKGLPSAPLSDDDKENALCKAVELFPELGKVAGKKEIEHGLLHRLDTLTDGLILIGATQDFYDFMLSQQEQGHFIKYYTATCNKNLQNPKLLDGFPPQIETVEGGIIQSYFRSYGKGGKEVRPVTKDSGTAALKKLGKPKLYQTELVSINASDSDAASAGKTCVICRISQGYRHQVRCHLAWAGLPVVNDPIYNAAFRLAGDKAGEGDACGEEQLQFSATRIEFTNPVEKKLKIFNVERN